ncbi:uncharacterized protein LOC109812594 [Cajanus cajan]|uniref:uncharacterized protein LOC109812594 n=1 Tax=Cajanus cajan TaxID=3821 RepID=UPI00098D7ADB|nr:uncharacterized protein LOC109812594 [Cajanus cajan]
MAVLIRCSCFLARPRFSQPQFYANNPKPLLPGKLACLSLKPDKGVPLFKDTFDGSSEISSLLHCSKCKEDMHQRFPSLIFVASNILMFSMPNTALAETCETDNSVFNMPVLLEVALIGAYFYANDSIFVVTYYKIFLLLFVALVHMLYDKGLVY